MRKRSLLFLGLCFLLLFSGCKQEMAEQAEETAKLENFGYLLPGADQIFPDESSYDFSGMTDVSQEERPEYISSLLVGKKLEKSGVSLSEVVDSKKFGRKLYEELLSSRKDINSREVVTFEGKTTGELKKTMEAHPKAVIVIAAPEVLVDRTIELKDDTFLLGNGASFICQPNSGVKAVFSARGVKETIVDSVTIEGGAAYGFYYVDSSRMQISNCNICSMEEKPICIMGDSSYLWLLGNVCKENEQGGIYLAGGVSKALLYENCIENNGGMSNWMAGIVLGRGFEGGYKDWYTGFDERHFFPANGTVLYEANGYPHDVILYDNRVSGNNSSGIYCDGAYCCFFIDNTVEKNEKEGMCLDFGTSGCYVSHNTFCGNGNRSRQEDWVLVLDEVAEAGRMKDGSAKAKLPGISLDNAAYNILEYNNVENNSGSGIKMVRTSVRNLILSNEIAGNNVGANDKYHFYGIEMSGEGEYIPMGTLDASPDFENIVQGNTISGAHYAGIFLAENGCLNEITDNVIEGATMFSIEAISKKYNLIHNNTCDKGIRNEY